MGKKLDWKKELLHIIKILKDNGVDIEAIQTTQNGINIKRDYTYLKDIKQDGIDIETIIRENQLNGNYKIGHKINYFRQIYRGNVKGQMSEEERKVAEELGIVKKSPSDRQPPVFKGRKVSQFHIDFITKNLSKILSGELNTSETLKLLKKASISENETVIEDEGSIKRIVYMLLKDTPEELEKYKQVVKSNSGKRRNKKTITNGYELGEYNAEVERFKKVLIDEYLPQYIKGEITIDTIRKEFKIAHKTFEQIVRDYYISMGDNEGLEVYEKRKKENKGTSIEKSQAAKEMRSEVAEYEVVSNAEFLLLSEEEQDNQIIMKIRQLKLKEEICKEMTVTRVCTEETTISRVEKVKQYFRSKNDYANGVENFSEQDIRYIIFRYPTIISRTNETLDDKFAILTYFDEIDEQTAYGMIKTFPAIIGYSVERIKEQLELLQKENLIDSVISGPRRMMQSVELMYALIQFAKERYKTNNLDDIPSSSIFYGNSILKQAYKTSAEELKKRFPYDKLREWKTGNYIITGQAIGQATYKTINVTKTDEALEIVDKVCNQELKKEGK